MLVQTKGHTNQNCASAAAAAAASASMCLQSIATVWGNIVKAHVVVLHVNHNTAICNLSEIVCVCVWAPSKVDEIAFCVLVHGLPVRMAARTGLGGGPAFETEYGMKPEVTIRTPSATSICGVSKQRQTYSYTCKLTGWLPPPRSIA